jgi:hypothetical protein
MFPPGLLLKKCSLFVGSISEIDESETSRTPPASLVDNANFSLGPADRAGQTADGIFTRGGAQKVDNEISEFEISHQLMRKHINEIEHKKVSHCSVNYQAVTKDQEGSGSESPSILGLVGVFTCLVL